MPKIIYAWISTYTERERERNRERERERVSETENLITKKVISIIYTVAIDNG